MQERGKINNIKINTMFNDEFVTGNKRVNKGIATRNYELFRTSSGTSYTLSSLL